ncbi:MAG: DUF4175 family protein [Planctomycetota bacterium]
MPTTNVHLQPTLDQASLTDWRRLEGRVGGVRQRHQLSFLATGVCLALAVLISVFLGFSAADIVFKLETNTRVIFLTLALAGMAAVVFWRVIRPWQSMGGSVQTAHSIEHIYPQLEDQLSTALEYGRDPKLISATSSPALVGALIQQTAQRSAVYDFARAIHWKALVVATLLAFVLTLGVAIYAKTNPRLFKATLARFMRPTAAIPAPTLTEINTVRPGDAEFPVEHSVPVEVSISGRRPETATLSVWVGEQETGRWEDRQMERGEDDLYRATLRRLLDTTRYKVRAGDDESREFRIDVYRVPEISEFVLRLEYPAYTGRATETLAPGVGDVRALKGATVQVELKANTDLAAGQILFKSGRAVAPISVDGADKRKADASFKIEADDQYQIHISNAKGSGSSSWHSIKALKDRYPRVVIKSPEKDLMVHRDQTIEVEITADDDVGVREIGIFHSLGLDETKVMVRRLNPATPRADGKLIWELAQKGLKGGEVIAYYAYAFDNDTVSGPKMAKSDMHFLTVYDEQDYNNPQSPKKLPGTPPAIKQLDKLIDVQKKLLKETFAQARQKETALDKQTEQPPQKDAAAKKQAQVNEQEKAVAAKTAEAQKNLRDKVQDLLDKVKQDMARMPTDAKPDDANAPPEDPGLGDKELKHLEQSIEKMAQAEAQLKVPNTTEAVKPETEALRHLSETRRLLLSDQGDQCFKTAMNKQSKKKKQQEQDQREQDQRDAKQALAEMPKMLEREKQTERDLEELVERKKKNPPPTDRSQTPEQKKEQDDQRRLQRESQQKLDRLAKESQDRANKLENLASRNPEMQPAAEKMQQAGDKLEQAAKDAAQTGEKNLNNAQDKTRQAQKDTQDAQRNLRNAMEKQIRQELANLKKDTQELAQRQQDLAQKTNQIESPQDQSLDQKQQDKVASKAQLMRGMAGEQKDIQSELKEISDRMQQVAQRAGEKNLAGTKALEQSAQQAKEESAANQSAQKAQEAMSAAKSEDAKRETANAAKALEQIARSVQDAAQKTAAGDMQASASAMKKLQGLIKEQSDIGKELGEKRDLASLGRREDQVANETCDLAATVENLEALRQTGSEGVAKEKLNESAKQADAAAEALKGQDAVAAKSSVEKSEKSLRSALDEMERAVGKTLEEKARDAKGLAKAALENEEKSVDAVKQISPPSPGKQLDSAATGKRNEAVAKQNEAARDAKRLDQALEGLDELAREANPAAAAVAREAREVTEQAELPKSMEELGKSMAQIGDPKAAEHKTNKTPTPQEAAKQGEKLGHARQRGKTITTPQEAAEQGEKLAQVARNVGKTLDNYIAEAVGSQLDRLRAMEQSARELAEKAQKLAQDKAEPQSQAQHKSDQAEGAPQDQNNKNNPASKAPDNKGPLSQTDESFKKSDKQSESTSISDQREKLEKDLKRLQSKIERLEPGAPEIVKMREALNELQKAQTQAKNQNPNPKAPLSGGERNLGGPAFKRAQKALDEVVGGLIVRIERLLRAREVRPNEDEDAPKEYRALVDKYYRALSEDVEEK